MKTMHYSRYGYNGDYTYTSVCGKKVKTHQKNEDSTIYPKEANCKECIQTKEYAFDVADELSTPNGVTRRIYIESDFLHSDEFKSAQRDVYLLAESKGNKCVDRVFSQVIDNAWHDLERTWQAVKNADEIYSTSSFVPLCNNPSMGSPVIFNGMCKRAISENVTGKSVIVLNNAKHICWDYIDIKAMKKAFKKNDLYMYDDNFNIVKVDVSKIKQ